MRTNKERGFQENLVQNSASTSSASSPWALEGKLEGELPCLALHALCASFRLSIRARATAQGSARALLKVSALGMTSSSLPAPVPPLLAHSL